MLALSGGESLASAVVSDTETSGLARAPYSIDSDKVIGDSGVILLLAMRILGGRDLPRLRTTSELFTGHKIAAAADYPASFDIKEKKIELGFSDLIVINVRFLSVKSFLDCLIPDLVCIVLDWQWLAAGYYSSNYGLNWDTKVQGAFMKCKSLKSILLPNGRHDELASMMGTTAAAKKFALLGITYSFMTFDEAERRHPLGQQLQACSYLYTFL